MTITSTKCLWTRLQRRGIDVLPRTLSQALDCLEEDEVIQSALGPEYAPYYIEVKREEWRSYHQSISQWETDNYLGTLLILYTC